MKNNELIVDATNMPELMAWADVAVAGGGTTAWEIAFMGLPSLVVVLAENQAASAQRLDEVGAMVCLGHTGPSLPENLGAALARLLDSPSIRRSLSGRARELVDGWGTERVTAVMRSKDLQ